MDFEAAVNQVFGDGVDVCGCFYHLTQSTWRKVQALGMATKYRTNENFRLLCGTLDGLIFLPVADVIAGLDWLKTQAQATYAGLVEYFDETYVNGVSRQLPARDATKEPCIRHTPPRFQPSLWNVHTATLQGGDRTNNISEGWNNRLRTLAGHHHLSVWRLQVDAAKSSATVPKHAVGNLAPRSKTKAARLHQQRLRNLCKDYVAGRRRLDEFLRAIGHGIRFACP